MKGIILAGGQGKRLYPITQGICKQLLPIYDKPMIYYPLSVLMLASIREVLIISTPEDLPRFQALFGDGSALGMRISYAPQPRPRGVAEAFLIGEDFIKDDPVCLILGDNIFYGDQLTTYLKNARTRKSGATLFGYIVKDPQRYGIIHFNRARRVTAIEEKPTASASNWACTGLYFYDNRVVGYAKTLRPSARGELEITDINNVYLKKKQLTVHTLGRGYAWLDTGTAESLIAASTFIQTIEKRQGLKIGCIEEIAFRKRFITKEQLLKIARAIPTPYGDYLKKIAQET